MSNQVSDPVMNIFFVHWAVISWGPKEKFWFGDSFPASGSGQQKRFLEVRWGVEAEGTEIKNGNLISTSHQQCPERWIRRLTASQPSEDAAKARLPEPGLPPYPITAREFGGAIARGFIFWEFRGKFFNCSPYDLKTLPSGPLTSRSL